MKTSKILKRFIPYYKKYTGILFMDLFCASLTTVCEMVFPLILRYITNEGMRDLTSLTVEVVGKAALLYCCNSCQTASADAEMHLFSCRSQFLHP